MAADLARATNLVKNQAFRIRAFATAQEVARKVLAGDSRSVDVTNASWARAVLAGDDLALTQFLHLVSTHPRVTEDAPKDTLRIIFRQYADLIMRVPPEPPLAGPAKPRWWRRLLG